MTDITETLKADSTQLNAIDFTGTSKTYTVTSVRVVKGDQPVNIRLKEEVDGREYRPSKSMRRVLASIWGANSDDWEGKRFTLYCDESVTWGGKAVGGIKISAMSGLTAPKKVMIQESSTVRKPHTVQPLPDAPAATQQPPEPTAEQVARCNDVDELRSWWSASSPEMQATIRARVDELNAQAPEGEA